MVFAPEDAKTRNAMRCLLCAGVATADNVIAVVHAGMKYGVARSSRQAVVIRHRRWAGKHIAVVSAPTENATLRWL